MLSSPAQIIIFLPPILLALTVHEAAHAWTANRLGDPTARLMGRMSLNPLVHLDPIGTIAIVVAGVGWARPVPVDTRYLRRPKRDLFWIASAGPLSNLLQALVLGLLLRTVANDGIDIGRSFLSGVMPSGMLPSLLAMTYYAFLINILLAWFNLIPIPPLDGSKIAMRFMSPAATNAYLEFSRYGVFVLLGVIFVAPGLFWAIVGPPVGLTTYLLGGFWL
jgi:Zn-dependent protease